MKDFVIVTGYHCHPQLGKWQQAFHRLWWSHNIEPIRSASLKDVYVIYTAQSALPSPVSGRWIPVHGDLGCCDDILRLGKKVWCPGCPATWMAGAWLAYSSQCDMLYIEQDCLCFGPWLERMQEDIGDKGMVFGTGSAHGGSSTCLFLVRWEFIPKWTSLYLSEGPEDAPARIAEHKMRRMRELFPDYFAKLSFGYDTDRPIDVRSPVFYAQKLTPREIDCLCESGRLRSDIALPYSRCYTNNC